MNKKILIIEDEKKIVQILKAYLEQENYKVVYAYDGKSALEIFEKENFDLVILDLLLPEVSGEEICQIIREKSRIPILILSAKGLYEEKIKGLDLGADDYITKPFNPQEVLARVRAILRRTSQESLPLKTHLKFDNGKLIIDLTRRQVIKNGKIIYLTKNEFKLLLALIENPGWILSRQKLIEKVQGEDFEGYDRTIDAHIKNLRKKIEDLPLNPQFIKTVYGIGYKFDAA